MQNLRLRIETGPVGGHDTTVTLGDLDITHTVNEVALDVRIGDLTTAWLKITPDELEIDADAMLKLKAEVRA